MNKPLILVVEDDAPIRNLIATTLKAHDYRFTLACNGEEALREAATANPDILLLDLGLPDLDGVEIIRRVRSWSDMPIIVLSARSEDADKIEALDSGADDYLTKPFSVEELLARLRVTLRRLAALPSSGSPVFINGQLRIDFAAGCAFLGEGRVPGLPEEAQACRQKDRRAGWDSLRCRRFWPLPPDSFCGWHDAGRQSFSQWPPRGK